MARPAKILAANSSHLTLSARASRERTETAIRGRTDKLKPPKHLNSEQKKLFKWIVSELKEANTLGNLDVFILEKTAVTIDTMRTLDARANEDRELLYDTAFRMARAEASKDFFRCCNELCLSPQSRAKLSIAAAAEADNKPTILQLLQDDDDG